MVLVADKDHLSNARLDDELGALVAGEQGHIHRAALDVGRVLVQDGVELCVTHWAEKQVVLTTVLYCTALNITHH